MLKLHASVYPATSYKIFVRHIAKSRIYLLDGPVNNNCINDYLVLPRLRCQDFSPHGHFAPWTLRPNCRRYLLPREPLQLPRLGRVG